jgi:hypothetical protein
MTRVRLYNEARARLGRRSLSLYSTLVVEGHAPVLVNIRGVAVPSAAVRGGPPLPLNREGVMINCHVYASVTPPPQ